MRSRWIIAALLAASAVARAQEGDVVVSGVVKDSATGKPLAGVSVYREETDEVAVTDERGAFSFPPGPAGRWHLAVIDPSYQKAELPSDGSAALDFELVPLSVQGEEIVVETTRDHDSAGEAELPRDEVTHVPGSNGDPLKAIRNLPGVANTNPLGFQPGLVIRGSAPQDSQIFVDGFEIPLLYHLGGIQSVIPGEMIEDLLYQPGGFGVEWGDASSGIVQVTTREGSRQWGGFADVSFLTAQGLVQGPIGKDGSFAAAVRRSYIDAVIPLVVPTSDSLSFTALPRYYDYQLRADYQLAPHWKLDAFVIGSDDDFGIATDATNPDDPDLSGQFSQTTSFTRGILAATYDRPGVYNRLAVSAMTTDSSLRVGSDRYLETGIDSLTARDEARIEPVHGVWLVAGGQAEIRSYDVDVKLPRPPAEGDPDMPNFTYDPLLDTHATGDASQLATWAATELEPAAWTRTTLGVRVDDFRRNHVVVAEPRAQQRIALADSTALLGAFGLYTRPPDNQDENLQADLKPERAWQSSLGVEQKLGRGVTLQTTAYYNDQSDLIVAREQRAGAMASDGSDTYENTGIGKEYGVEMLLKIQSERFFGWASYTFSRSERRDHPDDAWRMFDDDQPHNLIVLGSYKLGAAKQWQLGARFQYTSGAPYTPVTGAIFASDQNRYLPSYGTTNSLREPAQDQLDIRIDHYWTFQRWKLSAYLDVSNVYMNAPVYSYQYNDNYTKRTAVTGIPILPALGVRGEL